MISVRFQNAVLLGMVGLVIYSGRAVLTMATLDMVVRSDIQDPDVKNVENSTCAQPKITTNDILPEITSNETVTKDLVYDWDEGKIGLLNAAYYVGYVPAIMPGTILGEKISYFNYISLTLFATTLLTLTFPIITMTFGFYGAIASRIVLGIIHGPASSIISGLWYYWCLKEELTTISSIYQFGCGGGMLAGSVAGSYLLSMGFRWPIIFYAFGGVYFAIFIFFFFCADNRPESSKHILNRIRPFRYSKLITPDEVKLLVNDRPPQSEDQMLPWKKFLNMEVLLFNIAWFAATVAMMAFTIYMPRFLQYFMFIEMSEITKFITYQAIFTLPMVVLFSSLSDQMRKTISTPKVRKGFYIVPAIIFVAGIIAVVFYPCRKFILYGILTITGTANGILLTASCKPIPNDIGGKFASQVYSVSNTINNFAGIIAPVIVGILLKMGPIYAIETWYTVGGFTVLIQIFGIFAIVLPKLSVLPFTQTTSQIEEIIDDDLTASDEEKILTQR